MTKAELVAFLRGHRWAVQASRDAAGAPQAAVVGVAVTDDLEVVFDTLDATRKVVNLRADPRVALVIGWDDEQTVQVEGVADEPPEPERGRLQRAYFAAFPDGVERRAWPGITYVRVRPSWIRSSDFRGPAPRVIEAFDGFVPAAAPPDAPRGTRPRGGARA